jgi:predicted DNA repair protein MutK
MVGGTFLCFEGAEKILHKLFHSKDESHKPVVLEVADPVALEREKIRGAVFTDFILSAEIMVIALGAAAAAPFKVQAFTLTVIGVGMTFLVYGIVALVVKADDAGMWLQATKGEGVYARIRRMVGMGLLVGAPKFMRLLSVLGTAAMFLVGGEIVAHGIPQIDGLLKDGAVGAATLISIAPGLVAGTTKLLSVIVFGFLLGLICVGVVSTVKKLRCSLWSRPTSSTPS